MNICPNGLIKTHLVSFPRSGHHLMVRGLTEALGNKLVYSEYYTSKHNMDNCRFVNLQKSHDFELTDPVNENENYVVLIRDFAPAIKSWYETEQIRDDFEVFKEAKLAYYRAFVEKWMQPSILIIL